MDIAEKLQLITRNTDEVITIADLKQALELGIPLKHYIGFEISGFVHLGSGLMTGQKIADFQKAGAACSCFLATWHAWINEKLDGKLETIKACAKYFAEGLKVGIEICGGDPEAVKFVLADELYHNNDDYWKLVIEISKFLTITRVVRSATIMGRKESWQNPLAWLIYTPMQVADIFIQGINLAHAGIDQRKAHAVAREVALKIGKRLEWEGKPYKPIAVHHHLLLGLQPPSEKIPKEALTEYWSELKMSKSIGGSSIFLHDSPEEIRQKVFTAYCPEGEIIFNPLLDWAKHLLFPREGFALDVKREAKWGGPISFSSYAELERAFAARQLHPQDLKAAIAEALIKILEPARKHFAKPSIAKLKEEIEAVLKAKAKAA